MDFNITEEQELLLESLKEMLVREDIEEYIKECDINHEIPTKWFEAFANSGFALLGVPEQYGGTEVDVMTHVLFTEHVGKYGGPPYLASPALTVDDIIAFGNEEQIAIAMENAKQGKFPFALALSEPQSGSDSHAITTRATRKNGKIYINGQKSFISGANYLDNLLVVALDPSDKDPKAISMFWVKKNLPGVTVKGLSKIGWKLLDTCEVYLDNVEIEEKDLIGVQGNGFVQLMKNYELERLLLAASALGLAEAAFEDAARYANQRQQFGQKIGNFQLIQEKITRMAIKIENMRNMIYRCAWEKDNGKDINISASMAKLYSAQSAFEVCDDAVQILGGIGLTDDHRVSRMWRDARLYRVAGGTDEIMIHVIGRGILKQYSK